MRNSGNHARPYRLGCHCYAFLDVAAIALLALVIGGLVLQLVRFPGRTGHRSLDEVTAAGAAQAAAVA